MDLYRSFIAFQLPQKALDYCRIIKNSLKPNEFDAKWTKSQNLHITINFMGNKSKEDLVNIATNIRDINTAINRICFKADKIKSLGSKHSILCLKLTDVNNIAANIVNNILTANNLQSDYQIWLPHITLARLKSQETRKIFRSINNENLIDKNFKFTPISINVYISHLTSTGPIYKKISIE